MALVRVRDTNNDNAITYVSEEYLERWPEDGFEPAPLEDEQPAAPAADAPAPQKSNRPERWTAE